MKNSLIGIVLTLACASWGGTALQDALDNTSLTFTTGGSAEWFVETDDVHTGSSALRSGAISDDQETWLETTVSGSGMISFWWKADSESVNYDWLEVAVDGDVQAEVGGGDTGWVRKDVAMFGSGSHVIRWRYRKDSSGSGGFDCGWLDGVEWTPAPETMMVSFDVDGGAALDARPFAPGDVYGELPVPDKSGWSFGGWYEDENLTRPVRSSELVPFKESITLYAKWKRSVSYMHDAGLAYTSSGTDKFMQTNVQTPAGSLAAEAEIGYVYDWEYGGAYSSPTLAATVTGPVYLSFAWMGNSVRPNGGWSEGRFFVNGKEALHYDPWNHEGEWRTEYVYLPKGTHKLKWVAEGSANRFADGGREVWNEEWEEWDWEEFYVTNKPSFFVGDVKIEKTGAQKTPAAWAEKLHNYKVFVTGDVARFKKTYAARIAKDGADYEARIFHALALLAELAENATFKSFAKQFGYTFDYTHCTLTGTPKLTSKSPAVNTVVDKALTIAAPVLKSALADLQAIPDDWPGAVTLSADAWPIDETVSLDIADVRFARASLQTALASLYYLGGYDLTLDWAKVKGEMNWKKNLTKLSAIPPLDDDIAWSRVAPARGEAASREEEDLLLTDVRAVVSGSKIGILLERAVDWQPGEDFRSLDVELESGALKYEIEGYVASGGVCVEGENTSTNWYAWRSDTDQEYKLSASIKTCGPRMLITLNCSNIPSFSKKTWKIEGGHVGISGDYWLCGQWKCDDGAAVAQKVVTEQAKFLSKVRSQSRLDTSKTWVAKALAEALAADEAVYARTDDALHFIEYDPELADQQRVARDNTVLALQSLTDPDVELDIPDVCEAFGKTNCVDYTLLPNDGVMRVYLGALFSGKITRAMKPKTKLNSFSELVVNTASLPDPTFGGLLPDMAKETWGNIATAQGMAEDTPVLECPLVPGEKLQIDLSRFIGYSVTGLPKGWKWSASTGLLTGTASTKAVVLTFKSGGLTEKVTLNVAPKPKLSVSVATWTQDDLPGSVTVTGGGSYLANAKVKAVASVKSGYAFAGWYDPQGNLVSPAASYSFTMPKKDVVLQAATVALDEDYFWMETGRGNDNPVELEVGQAVDGNMGAYFEMETLSPCTVTASGLPDGVTLARLDGWRYALSGKATKKGVYYAKLSGKNNGGFRGTCVIKFIVGGAKESFANTAQVDLSEFEYADPCTGYGFEFMTEVPSANAVGTVKSVTVTGLPSGYKYKTVVEDGRRTLLIYGVATTPGVYTLTVNATCTNKKIAKSQRKVVVRDTGSVYIPVVLANGSAGLGTVSGGGVKHYGATVKLTATTKKFYFNGWYMDEDCSEPWESLLPSGKWLKSSASFQVTTDWSRGDWIYGKFVRNNASAVNHGLIEGLDTSDEGYEFQAGTSMKFDLLEALEISAADGWSLSVSGLPSGWTYSKGVVSGIATQTGYVRVTFTVKNAKTKKTDVATATFRMKGLAENEEMAFAVGTFTGSTLSYNPKQINPQYENGAISFTVTSAGKISGSYVVEGDKTAFSGAGVSWDADGNLAATVKGKVDGKQKSFKIVFHDDGSASFSGTISSTEAIRSEVLASNPWKRANAAELKLPAFASGVKASFAATGYLGGKAQKGTLTLSFAANGVVKAVWKTSKGSTSASLQIADIHNQDGGWNGWLVVAIPPNAKKKIAGLYGYLQLELMEGEDGLVHEVPVYSEEDASRPRFYGFGYLP